MARAKKAKVDHLATDDDKVQAAKVKLAPATEISSLVEKYIMLRDKKAKIQDEIKEKVAKIDGVLDKIEALLLATFEEQGMESVKTAAGTAYKSSRTSATVEDWDAAFGWIRETENWAMLERRVNKKCVESIKDETGELPPGVGWREEVVVNIRRS